MTETQINELCIELMSERGYEIKTEKDYDGAESMSIYKDGDCLGRFRAFTESRDAVWKFLLEPLGVGKRHAFATELLEQNGLDTAPDFVSPALLVYRVMNGVIDATPAQLSEAFCRTVAPDAVRELEGGS